MNHIATLLQTQDYQLNPPATEAEIAHSEKTLGTTLDPTWRAFLLSANGATQYDEDNLTAQWFSCAEISAIQADISAFLIKHFGNNWQQHSREEITDGLANTLLHPLWLPFYRNAIGQIYCLDHTQHPASVIEIFPDELDGDYHVIRVADSLEQWIELQQETQAGLNNENLLEFVEELMDEYGMLDKDGEFQSTPREYNLYDHIGLHIHSDEAFYALCEQLQHQPLSAYPCSMGTYYLYQESAEDGTLCLSVLVDTENHILNIFPYFIGNQPHIITAYHYLPIDNMPFSALCLAQWQNTSKTRPLFGFQIANAALQQETFPLSAPQSAQIHLSAFAQTIECYEDEEEFLTLEDGDIEALQANSFLPLTHSTTENNTTTPSANAIFCGEIQSITLRTNQLSEENFYHLLINTQSGNIDLLCHPDLLPQEAQIGNILKTSAHLIGHFMP